ncbi:MAG TPA: TerC family protein [Bacteroidales bacterium]|nr:TerC family protein [Bacteroidales bacterium]
MEVNVFFWIGFHILIFSLLALDLGIFNKKAHKIEVREALTWTGVWVSLAMLFNVFVLIEFGRQNALEFFTAYIIEYSLSVDNIFVFILIFTYFSIQPEYQHKIIFWGILGALVMRGIFIITGITLISKFHWIILVFGGFLVITGVKMIFQNNTAVDPEKNTFLRISRKIFRVTDTLRGNRLFVKENGKLYATPLFMVLLVIESSDLIFAVDSIPAVLAISKESFIVYTSNIFAILGLRSLYFAISGIMGYFRFLKIGLAFILTFVGVKMLLSFFRIEIPILLSLAVIIGILLISVMASLLLKSNK